MAQPTRFLRWPAGNGESGAQQGHAGGVGSADLPLRATTPLRSVAKPLLAWYDQMRRDLPFRRTRDPYAIWVSEVMLQQTQVSTVLPYYDRWMQRFPSVRCLALAEEAEVLHAWQGLGYYSRARSLLRAARAVVERHGGELPTRAEQLLELPGVGPYSAGAIASIAFGERVPVVDGNVVRVLCRLLELSGDPARAPLKRELWARASELVPSERPGDFNQALMELGATVCTAQKPRCGACPLRKICKALASQRVEELPELAQRAAPTRVRMAAAVLLGRGRALVMQAPADAPRWAGMWLFPAVELRPGESEPQAAARALRDGCGLKALCLEPLTVIKHSVTRYRITLSAYWGSSASERLAEGTSNAVRWVLLDQLATLAMPAAHRKLALSAAQRKTEMADRA